MPLSSSLERVFDLAKELQLQFRHSHMEPLHLLAAILKENSSEGAKLLRRSGVTLENVLSGLSRTGED
jgi:ATP-dependent Clp protease ATP-binding subunit ClpA